MQSIPKKVKGFTILEVIIVLTLVGIISAIGIPNFNSWNKDRVVRAEAESCLLYTSPSPRDH